MLKILCTDMMSQQGDNAHRSGRHLRTKLMSQYIGSGQNNWFDVRIQELVSKVQNPGGFLRNKPKNWSK